MRWPPERDGRNWPSLKQKQRTMREGRQRCAEGRLWKRVGA